jgi:MFS transporter, DHA2 family, multidrug resistance protein
MAQAAAQSDLLHAEWHSPVNPWLVALAVMSATFMEVLDTTVVNVSLPHIAGNLSASTEEATWVLTSYLVANAIILPATGWLSARFGRKNVLTTCIVIFTVASAVCGIANSLGMLILARVLQGAGGGALQPISQAVLLESFPPRRRGVAMAVFGLGVVVAPIIGPTLGGWITDNYSWRWVFYLNLPIGVMAVLLVQMMVIDPPYLRHGHHGTKIDYIGFGLLALWVGSLQVMLDKGQQEDWLASPLIRTLAIGAAFGLLAFVIWELCVEHPIVNLRILKNRNFAAGTALMTVVGAVLYASIALVPLFLQQLMGYSAVQSGMAISPRGLGSLCMMLVVGRLIGIIDARFLIFCGFIILGFATMMFGDLTLSMAPRNITLPNVISGAALALLFVPLSSLAVATLSNREMGNATGIYNLMRNLGGSIGIAMVTTLLARNAQNHQVAMVAHLTPYDPAYQERLASITQRLTPALGSVAAGNAAPGIIYQTTVQQATLMAFVDDFRLLAIMCFLCVPAVFLFSRPKRHAAPPPGAH